MIRALRAEMMRTRGSAALLLTLSGLIFALLSSRFAVSAGVNGSAHDLLNWQSLYATGLAAPIMTLLAGAVVDRERGAREGGTRWRSTPRHLILIARALVLIVLSGVFHVLSYGGIAVVAMLTGFADAMGSIMVAALVSWVSSWALCLPGLVLADLAGTIPAVLMALALQIIGTLPAEKSWWWAAPMTWPVRPSLWALGVHQNAVPLEPGETPIITEPWTALAGCIITAAASLVVLLLLDRNTVHLPWVGRRAVVAPAPRRSTRGGALGAAHLALHGTAIGWLTAGALALMVGVALVDRPGAAAGTFSYLVLPVGAITLPVVAWSGVRDAWRITALRGPRTRHALVARIIIHVAAMTAAAVMAVLLEGSPEDLPRRALLWALTGAVVALASLATTIRFGPGMAIAGGLLWWIFSVTFAGDVLAATPLWAVSLPLWAECADTPARLMLAVPTCLALFIGLLFMVRHAETVRLRAG